MNKLFHYTKIDAAYQILLNKTFRFGHFENHNDPFENLSKRYQLAGISDLASQDYITSLAKFVNTKISVGCFGTESNNSPGYYKPTMWAHYAENHKGVCLVFREDEFLNEIKKLNQNPIIKKIKYQQRMQSLILPPQVIKDNIVEPYENFLRKFDDTLLFSKHQDWNVENETRVVVFEESFEIPIDNCLHLVAYGPDISNKDEENLDKLAKYLFQSVTFGKLHYCASQHYASPLNFLFADKFPGKNCRDYICKNQT